MFREHAYKSYYVHKERSTRRAFARQHAPFGAADSGADFAFYACHMNEGAAMLEEAVRNSGDERCG